MGRSRSRRHGHRSSDDIFDVTPDIECMVRMRTVAEAVAEVRNTVTSAHRRGASVVINIITGKGRNSPGRVSRLKPAIRRLLEGELAPFIMEWYRNVDESGFLVRVK